MKLKEFIQAVNPEIVIPTYMDGVLNHLESGKKIVISRPRYTLADAERAARKAMEKVLSETSDGSAE